MTLMESWRWMLMVLWWRLPWRWSHLFFMPDWWLLDDAFGAMMFVELIFYVRDDCYLDGRASYAHDDFSHILYSRGTWYLWATWVDILARAVWMVLAWTVWAWADPLVDWQSTWPLPTTTFEHLHQLLFFSFHLHQLQPSSASAFILLQHPASSSQLPFAIDAKGGEMFTGRDVLVRGSSPWGGACCQLSSMTKGEIFGQFESCMVCLCLMFVIDVNWVFCCGLVFGLGPMWSPSWVLVVVLFARPFSHI